MVAGGRVGEVAGDGEDGGGHEVPVPDPLPHGQPAQSGGEEPGGERVSRSDGGHDVDAEGRDERDGVGTFSPSGTRGPGSGGISSPSGV